MAINLIKHNKRPHFTFRAAVDSIELEMARSFRYFSIFLQFILLVNSTRSNNHSIKVNSDTVRTIYSLKKHVSKTTSDVSTIYWKGKDDCLNDLSAITNGLENLDEWAINCV